MSALHFIGKLDKQEEAFLLSAQQEQTMVRTLFKDRDPTLYAKYNVPVGTTTIFPMPR